MDASLIAALRTEERMILSELRGSVHFRRLEQVRQLLGLYAPQPSEPPAGETPIGADLDAMLGDAAACRVLASAQHQAVIALRGERAVA
jgi:hypothetical protein